jgi:quinohemoprotein ethanol dehydrogenase
MRSNRVLIAATALAIAAVGLGGAALGAGPTRFGQIDDARLKNAANEPQNWLAHGGDQQAHRFSGLTQITPENIAGLKPAWFMEFDTKRGQEATPIVVDGVAYVTTAWSKVYAVDAKTGKQLWFYDPKVPGDAGPKGCCDVVNRGPAVYQGKVFAGTYDGRLIALDARTGKLVWSATTTDPKAVYSISSAPRVANGLVYIGNAGGEFGGRGYVTAYNAATGRKVWRFFITPGDPKKPDGEASDDVMASLVQPTWFGPHTDYRGGGHVWNSMLYDAEFDTLYMATGNGYPWVRKFRSDNKGDNLFISSIVAVDAKTGKYKWHYQESPGDSWDYDSVADMIMTDLTIQGQARKVLMHTPKNGFFYVLDRATGKLISAEPYVPGVTWASKIDMATGRPVMNPKAYYDNEPVRLSPGEGGGHSWPPTAFSPKTGLMYLQATAHATTRYLPRPSFEFVKGLDNLGVYHFVNHGPQETPAADGYDADPNAPKVEQYLLAWDPVAQKAAWKTESTGTGVLATAGNLVFQAGSRNTVMGEIYAYRADNGQKVWSYKTPNALVGGIVSYMVDGEQYILAPTGAGGGSVIAGTPDVRQNQPGRLVAFKLNGKASLPADPPPAPLPPPPAGTWPANVILQGGEQYLALCAHCHGLNTISPNIIPDLKRSKALGNVALWKAIVEGGAMKATGMISWSPYLPAGGAEAIRAYVITEARKEAAGPKVATR